MDFNSPLDSIIKMKSKPKGHGYATTRHRHSYSSTSSSSSPSSSRPYSNRHEARRDKQYYESDTTGVDLRSRIGLQQNKIGDRLYPLEKNDLRGRIGKRVATGVGAGLSTSNLPNRQRQQRTTTTTTSTDDTHSLVITKPVYPSTSSTGVDPASIVITKKIKPTNYSKEQKAPPSPPLLSIRNDLTTPTQSQPQQPNEAERSFQHYLQQQQQEQQLRQQVNQQLQQQLQTQSDQILELQRQLTQRSEFASQQQSMLQQQQQQQTPSSIATLSNDTNRNNFSFRPMMNNDHMIPPHNRSNTVILSNLDPVATSTDVQISCAMFGPVIRCDLVRDRLGRSCGEAEVEFLEHNSALDCVAKFDNEYIDDRIIRATLRQPPIHPTIRSVIAPTRSGYRTTSQVLYTDKRS